MWDLCGLVPQDLGVIVRCPGSWQAAHPAMPVALFPGPGLSFFMGKMEAEMTTDFSFESAVLDAIFNGHPDTEMVESEQLFAMVQA